MGVAEQQVQNQIMRYLALHDGVRVFRQNTGVATYKGQRVRFGIPGQGDIRCIISPEGWLAEIEVKSTRGRQATQQKKYQYMMETMGACYVLANSVEDVWQAFRVRYPHICWLTPGEAFV